MSSFYGNSNKVFDSEADALKAEGYAINKQNGVNVGAGSPYYHNSAKYFSSQAQNFSGDAEAYAKGSRGGIAVQSSDPAYHNSAKYYAEQAAESAQTLVVLPAAPTENGTYKLQCVVSNGTPTYSWVSDS